MNVYGYHRTSTKEQHLDRGIEEITKYCRDNQLNLISIFTDQQTGRNFNRPRYTVLVEDVLRSGDILIVTELDRLGRNKKDTMEQIRRFRDMGVRLMVLELPTTLMDLSKMENALAKLMMETINNMMLELYASMAEAEMEKKEKRQREGIAMKKQRGEWEDYGRPAAIQQEEFNQAYERVNPGCVDVEWYDTIVRLDQEMPEKCRETYFPELNNYRRKAGEIVGVDWESL